MSGRCPLPAIQPSIHPTKAWPSVTRSVKTVLAIHVHPDSQVDATIIEFTWCRRDMVLQGSGPQLRIMLIPFLLARLKEERRTPMPPSLSEDLSVPRKNRFFSCLLFEFLPRHFWPEMIKGRISNGYLIGFMIEAKYNVGYRGLDLHPRLLLAKLANLAPRRSRTRLGGLVEL